MVYQAGLEFLEMDALAKNALASILRQLGKLAENIFYVQAYSGHGVAPTHIMARIIAEAINGESNRFEVLSRIKHRAFPGGKYLRRPGYALGMSYYKARDYW